jgi:protein involved in polysaccharide export with SLBB domain
LHDDYLFFPPLDLIHNFVSIVGAVNKETKFQFVEGDHLSDAVELALGYDPAYEGIKKITISRLSINGETEERLEFTSSEDPLLRRGDRIRVTAGESNRKDFRVYVDGEVRSPGFIPITKSKTTLRDVIILAGGFTDKADLSKAELLRGANVFRSTFFTEEFEELMMNRMADITPEDSTTFFIDNRLRFARGNGTVDFTQLFSDSSDAGNFIVRPDDYISIPEKLDLVYVFGHVNSPGYLSYVPSQGYQYYLQKAGGIGQNPKGEIYLIKGKSRTWFLIDPEHPPKIEAGDYLWVPKQPARTFEYYLSRTTAISGIVSAVATILLLVVQLTK